jgi:hypothetical protein
MQEGKLIFLKEAETLQEETGEIKISKAIARIMKGEQPGNDWIDKVFHLNSNEKTI